MVNKELPSFELFLAYNVVRFELPRNGEPHIQIQHWIDGSLREITFGVYRNTKTNELSFNVVRHFIDPESQAWFPDSEPWPVEEQEALEELNEN